MSERISLRELREREPDYRLRPPFRYVRLSVGERDALIAVVKAADPFDVPCDCESGQRCDTYLTLHRALARFKDHEASAC